MIIEDELKTLKLPKQIEPYIGAYYKALCKRAEADLVGESEYFCFKRFVDMANSGKYIFAEKAIKLLFAFLNLLIYIDEDGKPHRLELYPVQKFIMCGIFGLRHKDGRYLAHVANLYMARRNGKSFLLSSILHALMGMSKFRGERIILASCKGQNATICFDEFCKFIDNEPYLKEQYSNINRTAYWAKHKLSNNRLEMFRTGGASKKSLDGFTNRVAVIDEEMLCDEIITKTIQDGQAHFKDSLLVTMSTAQYEIGSDNHKKWLTLRRQLYAGTLPDDVFLFLAEPDEEDITAKEYGSITFWGKANPVLLFEQDGFTIKEHIRKKYLQKARQAISAKGFSLQTFCTKQANIWYSAEDRSICTYEQLCACRVKYSFDDVIKAGYRYWYLGIDLAQVNDLASVNFQVYIYERDGQIVAPGENYTKQRLFIHTVSWMPKAKLTQHVEKDKFCYYDYVGTELELCEAAGGENIDTHQIYEYIENTCKSKDIAIITTTADPYNIAGIESDLDAISSEALILQNQTPKALSQYIEALSQAFKDGQVAYQEGCEDIFEKAVTNSVLVRNSSGYYSVEKITLNSSSNIRIDPLDATLNAFIANYIDNSRGTVTGDDALEEWEDLLGGE